MGRMASNRTRPGRHRHLALALTLALAVAGGGCGQVKEDKQKLLLDSATSGYRQSIRWGYYEAAVGFLHPDVRADIDFDALNNIRVTGYEVVVPAVIGDGGSAVQPAVTAVQLVQIEYVLNDRQLLKRLADRQEWRYDDERESWWLQSGLPTFVQ